MAAGARSEEVKLSFPDAILGLAALAIEIVIECVSRQIESGDDKAWVGAQAAELLARGEQPDHGGGLLRTVDARQPQHAGEHHLPAEDVERQVAVVIVIAMELRPFLLSVQRHIRGVDIEHPFFGYLVSCGNEPEKSGSSPQRFAKKIEALREQHGRVRKSHLRPEGSTLGVRPEGSAEGVHAEMALERCATSGVAHPAAAVVSFAIFAPLR